MIMSLTRIMGALPVLSWYSIYWKTPVEDCSKLFLQVGITDTGVEHCFQLVDKYAFDRLYIPERQRGTFQ